MKIAMMVRGYIPVPRPADIVYAPIDLAVAISQGLIKRGHHVDFYAPVGSQLKNVPIKSCDLRPLAQNYPEFQGLLNSVDLLTHYIPGLWDQYLSSAMFSRANQGGYDLLHFHHPETAMPLAKLFPKVPVVYTLHDPIYGWYHEMFHLYQSPNQLYISISDNQRRSAPELPYIATAYNGIDMSLFPFSDQHDNYLLFVGRIVPDKGAKEAIEIAKATNHKLLIIGPTYQDKRSYFDDYIEPELNDQIIYLGYIDHDKLAPYYARAKALISPIQWEEPFGLTMIEAMACGTPVITYRRGSAPEIVTDGKTGFVVKNKREMISAVKKIETISRRACRRRVETKFSLETMIDSYERAFSQIIALRKGKKLIRPFPKLQKQLWRTPRVVPQLIPKRPQANK